MKVTGGAKYNASPVIMNASPAKNVAAPALMSAGVYIKDRCILHCIPCKADCRGMFAFGGRLITLF
jgi:hypothetical protein